MLLYFLPHLARWGCRNAEDPLGVCGAVWDTLWQRLLWSHREMRGQGAAPARSPCVMPVESPPPALPPPPIRTWPPRSWTVSARLPSADTAPRPSLDCGFLVGGEWEGSPVKASASRPSSASMVTQFIHQGEQDRWSHLQGALFLGWPRWVISNVEWTLADSECLERGCNSKYSKYFSYCVEKLISLIECRENMQLYVTACPVCTLQCVGLQRAVKHVLWLVFLVVLFVYFTGRAAVPEPPVQLAVGRLRFPQIAVPPSAGAQSWPQRRTRGSGRLSGPVETRNGKISKSHGLVCLHFSVIKDKPKCW